MTGLIVFVALMAAGGLVIGFTVGDWWGERRMRLDYEAAREERRAVREIRGWRGTRGGTVMPYKPSDLPCGCPRGMRYHAMNCPEFPDQLQVPEVAHEWEPVHVGQALALTRPGQAAAAFDVEAETARYAQVADEIIAYARAASEPWTGP